jgi:hypothetical protein
MFLEYLRFYRNFPKKEDSGSGGGLGGPFMPQAEMAAPIATIKKIIIIFFTTLPCTFDPITYFS